MRGACIAISLLASGVLGGCASTATRGVEPVAMGKPVPAAVFGFAQEAGKPYRWVLCGKGFPCPAATPKMRASPVIVSRAQASTEKVAVSPQKTVEAPRKVTVVFAHNSSQLDELAAKRLDEIVGQNVAWVLEIHGYADSSGSASYNVALSRRRVERVKKYLVRQGVDMTRIKGAQAHGECCPVAPNDSAAGRSANRRVEILWITPSGG